MIVSRNLWAKIIRKYHRSLKFWKPCNRPLHSASFCSVQSSYKWQVFPFALVHCPRQRPSSYQSGRMNDSTHIWPSSHVCPGGGYTLLPHSYLKWGQARRKKDEKWTCEKNFLSSAILFAETWGRRRGLKTRRWHIGDVLRILGGMGLKGSCSHDGNIGMLPGLCRNTVSYLGRFILILWLRVEN